MQDAGNIAAAEELRPPARIRAGNKEPGPKLVIIGNGMVGYKLCERLAANGGAEYYDIVVFGEEPRPAYDRVHLTDFLSGRSSDELTLASREWYEERGIALHTGCRVEFIDRESRTVHTQTGETFHYDKLVFATGSRPFVPKMDGIHLPNVFVYRTVDDLVAIRDAAATATSAAVIGGGLLGLEAARALHALGLDCHVLEFGPHVLCAQLDSAAGKLAQQQIEAMGISVRVNVRVASIQAEGMSRLVSFSDPAEAPVLTDLVVIATGVRPRHDLAENCGLTIGGPGGILINNRLESSDSDIYAIGECASHRDTTYGIVAPGYRMAEVLAENLMGGEREFAGSDLSTRLKVMGLDVAVFGDYKQPGETVGWESGGSHRRLVIKGDRLIGASALGEWPEARRVQEAILKNRRLWPWQIARFRRRGTIWPAGPDSVHDWPAAATVCNCMNVSCGTLKQVCAAGCASVEELARSTGASTLCGSCKPLLAELVGGDPGGVSPGDRSLISSAVIAFMLIALFIFAPAIPYSETVRQSIPYDAIWRDTIVKQATGFVLVALSLAGLAMSLRKRLKSFRWGQFGLWRALHAIFGVAGLLLLVAHTGMRSGSNLNFILMTSFVGANLAGALAGGTAGYAGRFGPWGMALRRWLTWCHIAFVWPLPVLLAFHIVAAYYF